MGLWRNCSFVTEGFWTWGAATARPILNDGNRQLSSLDDFRVWLRLRIRVLGFGLIQDGDVGVGVFPEGERS